MFLSRSNFFKKFREGGFKMDDAGMSKGLMWFHAIVPALLFFGCIGVVVWASFERGKKKELKKENNKLKNDVNRLERGILRSDHC